MTIWAIVPVKPLRRGKSRLATTLTEDERAELNNQLLIHTLKTLKQTPAVEEVLVVSRDPKALSIAREHGARTVQESGTPHLNFALARATHVALANSARGIMVLPADLPKISKSDIEAMLTCAGEPPVIAIVPDSRKEGTNGLFIHPAGLIG